MKRMVSAVFNVLILTNSYFHLTNLNTNIQNRHLPWFPSTFKIENGATLFNRYYVRVVDTNGQSYAQSGDFVGCFGTDHAESKNLYNTSDFRHSKLRSDPSQYIPQMDGFVVSCFGIGDYLSYNTIKFKYYRSATQTETILIYKDSSFSHAPNIADLPGTFAPIDTAENITYYDASFRMQPIGMGSITNPVLMIPDNVFFVNNCTQRNANDAPEYNTDGGGISFARKLLTEYVEGNHKIFYDSLDETNRNDMMLMAFRCYDRLRSNILRIVDIVHVLKTVYRLPFAETPSYTIPCLGSMSLTMTNNTYDPGSYFKYSTCLIQSGLIQNIRNWTSYYTGF